MSLRLEMLRALRLSRTHLGDDAARLVSNFIRSQLSPQGGFCDRAGRADLYYTVFGLDALAGLGEALPDEAIAYINGFENGEALDLVHLCCLVRCRASAGIGWTAGALSARLETYRAADGGYGADAGESTCSAYGCFLVTMAYQDLGQEMPHRRAMIDALLNLRTADGGFANQPQQTIGLTPATAAVASLLAADCPAGIAEWLLARRHPESGFFAVPAAPIPDLLSTATSLQALARLGVSLAPLREPCLDFLNSLWTGGAFAGSWADTTPDCEYTFYGLLALGHLSV